MAPSWIMLILSILFNVIGTTFVKLTVGFTKLWPTLWMFFFYGLSLFCFGIALKHINISVAYAVWAGLGTLLITLIGVFFFKEAMTAVKAAAIFFVIAGVVALRLTAP